MLCLDLDDFKMVNDTLGHGAGDLLLKGVAARLKNAAGASAHIARWGGDEFVILWQGGAQGETLSAFADRLHAAICEPMEVDGETIEPRGSIGVACFPQDGREPQTLMRNADLALYDIKARNTGGVRFYVAEFEKAFEQKRVMENELRDAVARGEICAYYQPIVEIPSGKVVGFEALARWVHPQRGLVPPVDFIPVAESSGLIVEIGTSILQQACAAAASWPDNLKIAVNLSPVQVRRPSLALQVMAALEKTGLAPHRLELEITESVLMQEGPESQANLQAIRALGVRISLDDFGTGFSSLSYLQTFPFDRIKIDRSFVRDIDNRAESLAIVSAVTELARRLGMTTTVEGVETEGQMDILVAHGCTTAQGYYFSRPIPERDVPAFLSSKAAAKAA